MPDLQLCVIGDRHASTLKNAWHAVSAQHPGVGMTFFATSGTGLAELFTDARHLRHRAENIRRDLRESSGYGEDIPVDNFDAFVIHGAGLGFLPVLRHAVHCQWLAPVSGKAGQRSLAMADELALHLEATPALRLARMLIALDKPVLLSAEPLPALPEPDGLAGSEVDFWEACLHADGSARPAAASLHAAFTQLLRQRGYLQQPADTVLAPFFTVPAAESGNGAATAGGLEAGVLANMITQARSLPLRPAEERVEPEMSFLERFLVQQKRLAREAKRNPLHAALPERALWSKSAGNAGDPSNWYRRKFPIEGLRIATAGEFFSPRLAGLLRSAGFDVIDTEPVPADFCGISAMLHGYGCGSARFGQINSARQMLQLFDRAFGEFQPKEDAWAVDGGFLDPFRPALQPAPFASIEELQQEREQHLAAARTMFEQTDLLVLTLSHTEITASAHDGAVFPAHPGAFSAKHQPADYKASNLSAAENLKDLLTLIDKLRALRQDARFLLAVSPQPLAATQFPVPVLAADAYTKSVLQAVCRQVTFGRPYVDYFPACELVTSPLFDGRFHTPDRNGIVEEGVEHLMHVFFAEHRPLMPLDDEPFAED
jgi:hypothetical protein